MQTVANLMSYMKELVYVDKGDTIDRIQTVMMAKKVSHIPILSDKGQRNEHVVRRKDIWEWMSKHGGATPALKDVQKGPLPFVEHNEPLSLAMRKLASDSAVLVREADGRFTHFLSPRAVADAFRDYSSKFSVFERLETVIRKRLRQLPNKELAEAVSFSKDSIRQSTVDIERLTFAHYNLAFGRLWSKLNLEHLDRKTVLHLIESVQDYRNAVMHFRLEDNEDRLSIAIELLNLLEVDGQQ